MKAWKTYGTVILVCLLGACIAHGEEIGELDSSFGENGTVITSFGQYGDQAYAVALQPDGKILAAGSASNGYDLDLAIARYNQDGTLDTSFNTDGRVRTSIGKGDEEITAIGVQDDGYIVAAGYTVVDGGRDFLLARFTPDGDLDHSFGKGGIVITEFGNQDDEITAMTIDEEGRIVVCGYVTGTAGMIVALARYRENGDLDIIFGDQGIILTDIGDDALARSIDIDGEGRIVAAGSYFHQERTELMVLRFLESGSLDAGFGEAGIGVPADREQYSEGFGVRLLDDGRIMVAGAVGKPGDQDAAVYRFSEAGLPDASFGDNGVLITSAGKEDDMALAIDVLGNIVGLSGYNTFNTKRDFLFVSVEEKGDEGANVALNLKTGSFSSGGVKFNSVFDLNGQQENSAGQEETTESVTTHSVFSTTPLGYTEDVSYAVVLQSDGKAVSVGYSEQDGVPRFAVARYITPVANAAGSGGLNTPVDWILTREPTNVNRTGGYTGGTILDSGRTITQRGVVFSIAPDPIYDLADDGPSPAPDPGPDPGPDITPPEVTITEPDSEQEFSVDIGQVDLSVSTNENALCRYSAADVSFADMTLFAETASTTFTVSLTVENNTSYTYYVICRDLAENESGKKQVTFSVAASAVAVNNVSSSAATSSLEPAPRQVAANADSQSADAPLVVSNGSPTGEIASGSSMTYIGVYTSERSTCRYATLAGQDFDAMDETMATADNISHIAKVTGLMDDHSYEYYVRCRDFAGNENGAPYRVSFKVSGGNPMDAYRQVAGAIGKFFLTAAHAQSDTAEPEPETPSDNPASVFDLNAPAYAEKGSTDDGGGPGSYSSILKNLKPGTFYYVRAYAVDENDKVYYGNQVGFKTADSCFIATAAYGTLMHPYVKVLRSFRDQYLVTNVIGRNLVNLYYHYSPPVADYIAVRPVVRNAARVALLPVVGMGWLVLHIGFMGLALVAVFVIMPSLLVYRSYRRLEIL